MPHPVILVCGFGRCGSSLVMQMLSAGGFPVTGEYPTFEAKCPSHVLGADWWAAQRGKAVKRLLEPSYALDPMPHDTTYRAIWLDRDPVQQAMSAIKFMEGFLPPEMCPINNRSSRRALAQSYSRDRPRFVKSISRLCNEAPLALRFENILARPKEAAISIAEWIGNPLDIAAMASVVVPRPPSCYSGFLEMELMQQGNLLAVEKHHALPPTTCGSLYGLCE